jgi:hypothetical protein
MANPSLNRAARRICAGRSASLESANQRDVKKGPRAMMGLRTSRQYLPARLLIDVRKLVDEVDPAYRPTIYRTASDVRRASLSLESERRLYDRLLRARGLDSADPDVATAILIGRPSRAGRASGSAGGPRSACVVSDGSEPQGRGYVDQDGLGQNW